MGLDVSGGKTTKTFLLTPVILLLSLSSNIISETINMDGTDMKYLRILQSLLNQILHWRRYDGIQRTI
jgi:hypothetical protein